MIRTILYEPMSGRQTVGGKELLDAWRQIPDSIIWVDFFNEPLAEEKELMQNFFNLHPLAIMDAQRLRHPPKFEAFGDHSFILLKGLDAETRDIKFGTIQIAIFVGQRFLVTRHAEQSPSTDRIWAQAEEDPQSLAGGPGRVAVLLSGTVVDRYLPILLALETRLEELEDEMLQRPSDRLLAELVSHKTDLKKLLRVIAYHEQTIDTVRKSESPGIGSNLDHELNDVYEHLERMSSLSTLYYDLASDLMDGYITLASHKLNHIVKVLTIVTTVFVPLSFMAGLYGMNFENMPELGLRYAYFVLLGIMALTAGSIIFVLYRKGWLRSS
jgi:magnesium transporter